MVLLMPIGAFTKSPLLRSFMGLDTLAAYFKVNPESEIFIASFALVYMTVFRIPRYVIFFMYSLEMQNFYGRQNRIIYTCIRWISIIILLISVGSWWLYFSACGMLETMTVIQREVVSRIADDYMPIGGDSSYRDVCSQNGKLYGWISVLPDNALQYKVNVSETLYTEWRCSLGYPRISQMGLEISRTM